MLIDDRPLKDVYSHLLDLNDFYRRVWSWFNSQLTISYNNKIQLTFVPICVY